MSYFVGDPGGHLPGGAYTTAHTAGQANVAYGAFQGQPVTQGTSG